MKRIITAWGESYELLLIEGIIFGLVKSVV